MWNQPLPPPPALLLPAPSPQAAFDAKPIMVDPTGLQSSGPSHDMFQTGSMLPAQAVAQPVMVSPAANTGISGNVTTPVDSVSVGATSVQAPQSSLSSSKSPLPPTPSAHSPAPLSAASTTPEVTNPPPTKPAAPLSTPADATEETLAAALDAAKKPGPTKPPLGKAETLTPEIALDRVQSPASLPTAPIDAARSFQILPTGTILDTARHPLVPGSTSLRRTSPWQRHAFAIGGAALGTIAGVKLHHTLRPLDLKRLHWNPHTRWAEVDSVINTVTQPALNAIRESRLLNNTLTWAKATMCLTPVATGAIWGEQAQRRRRQTAEVVY